MRKIIYATWLKVTAVILFVACVVGGMLTVTDGTVTYMREELDLYSLEGDFSESWYLPFLLREPEHMVLDACRSVLYENDAGYEKDVDAYSSEIARAIESAFLNNADADKVNYYIRWNGNIITNTNEKTPEALIVGNYYNYIGEDEEGYVKRISSHETENYMIEELLQDSVGTIIISCNIKQETIDESREIWERQRNIVLHTAVKTLVCAVAALVFLIYLICVCGKNRDGECKTVWLDAIWLEVRLAAMAVLCIGAGICGILLVEAFRWEQLSGNLILLAVGIVSAVGSLGILSLVLSVVRNIKTRSLLKTSVLLGVLKWLFEKGKALSKTIIKAVSKKTGLICLSMLLLYTALIGLMGMGTPESPVWLMLGILLFGVAVFVVAGRAKDLEELKKGAGEIRNGNAAYRIPDVKCEDMKQLAADINDVAKGMDASVAAKVKAERLKSELITNVSHDLKTPITSIINYTELLSNMEELPEEARDYVAIIAKKSDRLKKLTQDLFDISKVQSGNEEVLLETLDVALLLHQTMGEHDNEIRTSGLPFCVEAPKELYISADGRKMSRVVGNLISNILKYAMKGTRVFVTASEKDGFVSVEFKNVSAYPLDFDAEEITQRFVRGDASRTAEGNGLGLAIAKSYTEVCGGTFEIVVDGDLFKAILKFPQKL